MAYGFEQFVVNNRAEYWLHEFGYLTVAAAFIGCVLSYWLCLCRRSTLDSRHAMRAVTRGPRVVAVRLDYGGLQRSTILADSGRRSFLVPLDYCRPVPRRVASRQLFSMFPSSCGAYHGRGAIRALKLIPYAVSPGLI